MADVVVHNQLAHYEVATNGKNGIVLFLHGWRSSIEAWRGLMQYFGGYTCILLDLPGFGGSPAPKEVWGVGDYAAFVTAFVQKQNLQNLAVVGHSFGGRISIKLAKDSPAWLTKVVLVNSAGIKYSSVFLATLKGAAKLVKPIFKLPVFKALRPKIYRFIGAEDYLSTPHLAEIFKKVIAEDLSHDAANITIPTLIVWGAKDTVTPLWQGKKLREIISGSKLVVLPNARHFSFVGDPQGAANAMLEFFGNR